MTLQFVYAWAPAPQLAENYADFLKSKNCKIFQQFSGISFKTVLVINAKSLTLEPCVNKNKHALQISGNTNMTNCTFIK